jgi:hypothetical protein
MNQFDHVDYSNYDLEPREPVVHSSFYASPNGKRSVRAYEIVNANQNIRKLKKTELDEPRFENSLSKFAKAVKNIFVSDTPRQKISKINDYGIKTRGVNVKKGVSFHTKNDGGLVAVTSLDLQNQHGDNAKLKEFVQRKAMADKVLVSRGAPMTAQRPMTVLMQPQQIIPQPVYQPQVPIYQNTLRTINTAQYY